MGSSSAGVPWEPSWMKNRAFYTLGLRLGSMFLGLLAGVAGADLYAAGTAAAPVCTSCHEQQGQKLAKSAHAELTCDTCHESHEKVPHPANIPKPVCSTCHADQAGDYDKGVHGQARKGGNEGAPDCSLPKPRAKRKKGDRRIFRPTDFGLYGSVEGGKCVCPLFGACIILGQEFS